MTDATKNMIDNMSYTEMLSRWRFAPAGDPMFVGESGKYFAEVMKKKRAEVGDDGHVAASKLIGWNMV